MINTAQKVFRESNDNNLEDILKSLKTSFTDEKELFEPEIKISIAYCDSLFEAGIFSRLEAEKVKNGLLTILKRAEFDKDYFDRSNAENIYQFIEEKLVQLIGSIGQKIQIGRSNNERYSTSIRIYLREEIAHISKTIHLLQTVFIRLAEVNKSQVFIAKPITDSAQPMLFAHWCLSYFEILKRDRERLDEVWRRVNTMPVGANNGIGSTLEFDREELAKKLGFQRITLNSFDTFKNKDYLLEFANSSTLIATHLISLIEEISDYNKTNNIIIDERIGQENLKLIKVNLRHIFHKQSEIQSNAQKQSRKFFGRNKTIFSLIANLKKCLDIIYLTLQTLQLNKQQINNDVERLLPNKYEVFEYLIQRNDEVRIARQNSNKIIELLKRNKSMQETKLEDLQKISKLIEQDFFVEMKLDTIINSKNQIGGTSIERVGEALEDAKKALQYEE